MFIFETILSIINTKGVLFMTFGERLKQLRNEKGITQQELADYIQVGRPTIAGYETKGKEPDFEKITLMCEFFSVSTDYLLGRENIGINDELDDLTKWIGKLLRPISEGSFQQKFIKMLSELDESDWITIEKIFNNMKE